MRVDDSNAPDATQQAGSERPRLGDLLVEAGVIDEAQLNVALAEQSRWDTPLGMTLVRLGYLDEATMVRALAGQLNIPVVALRGKRINAEIIDLVPNDLADKHRCLPLLINGDGEARKLYLGMEDPTQDAIAAEIAEHVGMPIQPVLVAPTELDEGIHRHYHWDSSGVDVGDTAPPIGSTRPTDSSEPAPPVLPPLDGDNSDAMFASPDQEPEFVDYAGSAEEEDVAEATDAAPAAVAPAGSTDAGSAEPMLRAIAQLLIEKGIFSRDELVERLRSITSGETGSG
jgi:type IV pilus assembly protein PilB